jgi:4-alpha-glucanotransferase
MKVVQFGFSVDDSPHLPHRYDENTVTYTGTHDNDTARGWFESAHADERERALLYLGAKDERDVAWGMIRAAYTSVAETAIIPVQDILSLGSDARMNTPGQEKDNWTWRLRPAALTREHSEHLRRLGVIAGR